MALFLELSQVQLGFFDLARTERRIDQASQNGFGLEIELVFFHFLQKRRELRISVAFGVHVEQTQKQVFCGLDEVGTNPIVVDFHAEATSEKVALPRWLDGRVTAVVGTHTHVQTNDARVLPGGTAAISDAGMTGPHDSVIGVQGDLAIARMRTGMPVRFRPAEGGVRLEGALVECDVGGRATSCEPVRVEA
jgi:calcineurin-like phosphoesterase